MKVGACSCPQEDRRLVSSRAVCVGSNGETALERVRACPKTTTGTPHLNNENRREGVGEDPEEPPKIVTEGLPASLNPGSTNATRPRSTARAVPGGRCRRGRSGRSASRR